MSLASPTSSVRYLADTLGFNGVPNVRSSSSPCYTPTHLGQGSREDLFV